MIVKQALVGSGRATKSEVEGCVMMELGLRKAPRPDDVSDALAIALTHVFLGELKLSGNSFVASRADLLADSREASRDAGAAAR